MESFNRLFDQTILKATTTDEDLRKICEDARKYGFHSVAVMPANVKKCAEFLAGSGVAPDAAISYPLGITTIEDKVFETEQAVKDGAAEIDYVIHIGKVKQGDYDYITREMAAMVAVCRRWGVVCKVIFENCYLTDAEKIRLCEIAEEVEPDYVKTSTGAGPSSATVEDVRLMCKHVGKKVLVKAAGGIRSLEDCLAMLEAGASRIGCSNSPAIVEAYQKRKG